jgi:pyrimidine operon attenuation protein/uracil phosphoribosyltransferase
MSTTEILNAEEIQFKIQRLAWELYDRHSRAQDPPRYGHQGQWVLVSGPISHSPARNFRYRRHPARARDGQGQPRSGRNAIDLPEGAELALVDDVLNSGRTLLWAVIKLMSFRPRVLSTTVLVDRSHKRYPVKADVKGISLSTTLQETVQFNVVGGKAVNVYLV